jgi:hypothetical protein
MSRIVIFMLYIKLVKYKWKYASVVTNADTSVDSTKLERMQKCISSLHLLFSHVPYSYTFALEKLSLHYLRKMQTTYIHFLCPDL